MKKRLVIEKTCPQGWTKVEKRIKTKEMIGPRENAVPWGGDGVKDRMWPRENISWGEDVSLRMDNG